MEHAHYVDEQSSDKLNVGFIGGTSIKKRLVGKILMDCWPFVKIFKLSLCYVCMYSYSSYVHTVAMEIKHKYGIGIAEKGCIQEYW